MNRIFTRTVEYDPKTDEYIIEIPEEICNELGLNPGNVLVYEHKEDMIILRKRLEY